MLLINLCSEIGIELIKRVFIPLKFSIFSNLNFLIIFLKLKNYLNLIKLEINNIILLLILFIYVIQIC